MENKKENASSFEYKRTKKEQIGDFFYETSRKLFWKNGKKPATNMGVKRGNQIFIIAMLVLPISNWILFWLYTNIQSIFMAFQDSQTKALTFDNFKDVWIMLSQGKDDLGLSFINTFKYFFIMVGVNTPLCLIIAYFFYKRIAGYKAFRIVFYLPAIIPGVVYVTAFSEFIDPYGAWGMIQRWFGTVPNEITPLARPETATNTIMVFCVLTGLTTNVLLFTSGMARIPVEVLEAAKLDGVGPVRELCQLIFPLIWPTFSTQMIFMLTGLFTSGGPILLFTNGLYDTTTLPYWIFKKIYDTTGYTAQQYAYHIVSCVGLCLTILGLPLILIVRKLVEHIDPVEY